MPGNKIIRPGFPILSMFLVTIFIWQYKKKYIKQGVIDGGETYDLFISYSRKQAKWVKKNVYIPLKGFKNSEDKKINIFFDEESIPPGEQFQDFYKEAILNSKIFLPVVKSSVIAVIHCCTFVICSQFLIVQLLKVICIQSLEKCNFSFE